MQPVPPLGVGGVEAEVVQAADEPVDGTGLEVVLGDVLEQGLGDQVAVAGVVEVVPRDADDPGVGVEVALALPLVEAGEQLAEGEVAGAAEDGEVAGRKGQVGEVCAHGCNRSAQECSRGTPLRSF